MQAIAEVAAISSAVAAWAGLSLAIMNRRMSHRAFRLTQQGYAEAQPDLRVALGEGLSFRRDADDYRVLALSVFIDNPSSSDDSVARVELEVRYTASSGAVMTVRLQHDPQLASALQTPAIKPLGLPERVPSFGSITGWMLFRLPDAVVDDGEIDGYRLTVHDTRGLRDAVETVILREVVREADLEAPS